MKVLFAVAAFFIASGFMLVACGNTSAAKHAPLIEYYRSSGGDMRGSHYVTKISRVDNEKAIVLSTSKEWHFMDNKVSEYYVSTNVLKSIEKVYDETELFKIQKAPKSKEFALDAATTSYSFSFEDRKSVHGSSMQDFPRNCRDGLKKINDIITEAIKKGEKLPGLVVPYEKLKEGYVKIPKDAFELQVYEYSDNVLHYRFANGKAEAVKVKGPIVLYRIDNGVPAVIKQEKETAEYVVDERYCQEVYMQIGSKRLSAGDYVLEACGYKVQFKIR